VVIISFRAWSGLRQKLILYLVVKNECQICEVNLIPLKHCVREKSLMNYSVTFLYVAAKYNILRQAEADHTQFYMSIKLFYVKKTDYPKVTRPNSRRSFACYLIP
jgi:hypothetical protein